MDAPLESPKRSVLSWLGLGFRIAFTLGCLAYLGFTVPFNDVVDLKGGQKARGALLPWPGGRLADPVEGVVLRLKGGVLRRIAPGDLGALPEAPETAVHLGLLSALGGIRWGLMGLAMLLMGMNQPILALRWKSLLDAQGIRLSFGSVLRLNFLGLFFNNTMPGQTGGDLVKAYAVAKKVPGRGTAAVVTVFLDRAVGLMGLVLMAGTVSVAMALHDPGFKNGIWVKAAWVIGGMLGGLILGGGFYLSPLRQRLLPPGRVASLRWIGPLLAEIDAAVTLYRDHRVAVLRCLSLGLLNHVGYILMGMAIGRALVISPDRAGLAHFIVLIPIVSIVGCLPISIMGFGVGDWAYVHE
jgi:uncharacterized membrane protein YbhN (UPF0104 family)